MEYRVVKRYKRESAFHNYEITSKYQIQFLKKNFFGGLSWEDMVEYVYDPFYGMFEKRISFNNLKDAKVCISNLRTPVFDDEVVR